jgi:hypothetical protein
MHSENLRQNYIHQSIEKARQLYTLSYEQGSVIACSYVTTVDDSMEALLWQQCHNEPTLQVQLKLTLSPSSKKEAVHSSV